MKVCIKTENLSNGCVTDKKQPTFTLNITSDKQGAELKRAQISVGEWRAETDGRIHIPYGGAVESLYRIRGKSRSRG